MTQKWKKMTTHIQNDKPKCKKNAKMTKQLFWNSQCLQAQDFPKNKLCESKLCVSKLCESKLCMRKLYERILYGGGLFVDKLCANKLKCKYSTYWIIKYNKNVYNNGRNCSSKKNRIAINTYFSTRRTVEHINNYKIIPIRFIAVNAKNT